MIATDLNHALGKLYSALAQNRISSRNANALARIGRTMFSTIPGIKTEFKIQLLFRPVERDAEGHQASFYPPCRLWRPYLRSMNPRLPQSKRTKSHATLKPAMRRLFASLS
jgi:hypothetical protein